MPSLADLEDYKDYIKSKKGIEMDKKKVASVEAWLEEKRRREGALKATRKALTDWARR